ncbi:hypothetical protein F4556_006599 [Kitasatospora gansuensis]|uniref:Uncharacterized protein n=1 Tax=Kitasatospora gansuensis TaxID=258050 RepID=A0A7W7SIF2_9ACTN|nr:hypothetical protein [Kitasatospora gansuensis]MBB4951064.1 hypothetical protein [Kitasatospora gansuensis]
MHETSRQALSGIVHDKPTDRIAIERASSPGTGPAAISGGSALTVHGVVA